MTVLASSDLCYNNFSSVPSLSTGGDKTYRIRFNNSYKDQRLELSQIPNLPKGTYKLSVDWYISRTDAGDGYISIGTDRTNASVASSWQLFSKVFTSSGGDITIKLGAYHNAYTEKFYAFDNFKLEWNLTKSLTDLLTDANTFYAEAGDTYTALKSAIDNADAVKESTDAAVLEAQYNALSEALTFAQHRKGWHDAWTTANTNDGLETYVNVTGSEKTALKTEIDKDEPTTADGYDAAKALLETANTTFTGAKDSYDALVAARTDATTNYTTALWPRASADKKTALDDAVAAAPADAADAVTKKEDIVTAIRQFVESNGLAEGDATAINYTSSISSAACENTSGWTLTATSGEAISVKDTSNEKYTMGNGNPSGKYLDGGWASNAVCNQTASQSFTLPAGQYQLQITARSNVDTYNMSVNDGGSLNESVDLPRDGNTGGTFGKGWSDKYLTFTLSDETEVTLTIHGESSENKQTWMSFNRLRLMKLNAAFATEADYTALSGAISAAEAKTLGFENGEYAPYNNVTALAKLAEAKAINPSANNDQSIVQALTTYLNTAANWTANESEVNAIWDSSFEHEYSTSGNVQPIAWKGTSGHDNATDVRWVWNVSSNAGLAATSSSKALFTKYGAFYGQEDGYTLPLNEGTYYTISFKYGGWDDCKKDGYVTITDANNETITLTSSDLPLDAVDGNNNTASWKSYTGIFKTNEAGNYILGLRKKNESQQSQYVYGDFIMKQTTLAEATAYYNIKLDEVDDDYDADANGGSEKTAFKIAIDADVSAYTVAQLMEAAASLKTLRDAFVAATPIYDKYAEECARAIELGVTSGDIAALTVASDYQTKLQALIVQEDEAVRSGYPVDVTGLLGTASTQNTEVGQGQHWYGPSYSYYNKYKNEGFTMSVKHTVTLPAGSYVYKGAARCNKVNEKEQYYIGVTPKNGTLKKELFTSYNGATGKGVDNDGHANYGDGDFVNEGNGYGWEWRFVGFTLEEPTEVELKITANILAEGWVSFADMCLLSQGLTITEDAEDTKINVTNPINVTLDRAFNAGWNAVCLPFATTKASLAEGAEFYEFTGDTGGENVTLNFSSVDNDNFEANTPYLVYLPAAVEGGKVFNGVNYNPAEAKTAGTAFDFMGVYAVTNIAAGNWVISGGALKKASDAIDLKPTRAYFAPKASTARIAGFTIDGDEATGLKAVMAEQGLPVDGIYNLKGQKVSGQLKKGIYVVNGKKIVK